VRRHRRILYTCRYVYIYYCRAEKISFPENRLPPLRFYPPDDGEGGILCSIAASHISPGTDATTPSKSDCTRKPQRWFQFYFYYYFLCSFIKFVYKYMYHLCPKVFIPLYNRPLDKSRHSLDFVALPRATSC